MGIATILWRKTSRSASIRVLSFGTAKAGESMSGRGTNIAKRHMGGFFSSWITASNHRLQEPAAGGTCLHRWIDTPVIVTRIGRLRCDFAPWHGMCLRWSNRCIAREFDEGLLGWFEGQGIGISYFCHDWSFPGPVAGDGDAGIGAFPRCVGCKWESRRACHAEDAGSKCDGETACHRGSRKA